MNTLERVLAGALIGTWLAIVLSYAYVCIASHWYKKGCHDMSEGAKRVLKETQHARSGRDGGPWGRCVGWVAVVEAPAGEGGPSAAPADRDDTAAAGDVARLSELELLERWYEQEGGEHGTQAHDSE